MFMSISGNMKPLCSSGRFWPRKGGSRAIIRLYVLRGFMKFHDKLMKMYVLGFDFKLEVPVNKVLHHVVCDSNLLADFKLVFIFG